MGMIIFAVGTLIPAIFLGLAAASGGLWPVLTILSIWAFKSAQAPLAIFAAPDNDPEIQFPASPEHSTLLAALHFLLLFAVVWAIGSSSGLSLFDRVGVLIAAALFFAQISHANALELVHTSDPVQALIGKGIFSSLLYGHFASAYPLVHDIHAATDDDPLSAASGENFYNYAPRALLGSARAGLVAENQRRALAPPARFARLTHPFVGYVGGALLSLLAASLIAGIAGILTLLAIASLVQLQILLRFYVRHFGLRRAKQADGSIAPLGPQHSWSMTTRLSEALTLFALRMSGDRALAAERIKDLMSDEKLSPKLPHAPMTMAVLALIPSKWHDAINGDLGTQLPDQPEHDPFSKLGADSDVLARVLQSQQQPPAEVAHPRYEAPAEAPQPQQLHPAKAAAQPQQVHPAKPPQPQQVHPAKAPQLHQLHPAKAPHAQAQARPLRQARTPRPAPYSVPGE